MAAGDGNFAIAAAGRGAAVMATDMTPRMVDMGRARSAAEGVAIEWLEADAEELPFAEDRSISWPPCSARSSRPGPNAWPRSCSEWRSRAAAWRWPTTLTTASCSLCRAHLVARAAGPGAAGVPFLWGEADVVRSRLERLATSIDVERRTGTFEFDSLEQGLAYWERTNGPQIALRTMLTDAAYQAMRERAGQLSRELNRARDGRLVLDFEYALVLARKAEPPV